MEITKDTIGTIKQVAYFGQSKLEKTTKSVVFVLRNDMDMNDFTLYQYVPKHKTLVEVGVITTYKFVKDLESGDFKGPYLILTENGLYDFDTDDMNAISEKAYLYRNLLTASRAETAMTKQAYMLRTIEGSDTTDSSGAEIYTAAESYQMATKEADSISKYFKGIEHAVESGDIDIMFVLPFEPCDKNINTLVDAGYDVTLKKYSNGEVGMTISWISKKISGGTVTREG